jgi:hypothetical protein
LIILDENILEGQRLLLHAWRLQARQIGLDVGRKGLKDEEIIVLLRRHRNSTFFTRDLGFYNPAFPHAKYCIVVASVEQTEVGAFVRRFLRHPTFDTQAKRMGKVVRISHAGMAIWRLRSDVEIHTVWDRATWHSQAAPTSKKSQ